MVFIPALWVYTHISAMVKATVIAKGTPHSSKTKICKTFATKNKRKAAPIVLDNRK